MIVHRTERAKTVLEVHVSSLLDQIHSWESVGEILPRAFAYVPGWSTST